MTARPRHLVCGLTAVAVALVLAGSGSPVHGQLPTATGRQYALSNAAWKLFVPATYQHRPGEVADLLVHFHGDPQTYWNNAQYAQLNAAIVTVNYSGLSSAYSTPFSNASLFQSIENEALAKLRSLSDFSDTLAWDKIGVSSFSAGYGAVREILKSATYRNDIDALLAADSLYATKAADGTPVDSQMVDYKTFAALAKNGEKTFIYSHSQVPTSYSSTVDCGNELLAALGIGVSRINVAGLGTLQFNRRAQSGNFELWGATGSDGDAHLEHLRYIGEFLEDLPLAKVTDFAGDFDGDGWVDGDDLVRWRSGFGVSAQGDADGDGDTDGADLLAWQRELGFAPSGVAAIAVVPEPGMFASAIGGIAAYVSLRRRGKSYCRRVTPRLASGFGETGLRHGAAVAYLPTADKSRARSAIWTNSRR